MTARARFTAEGVWRGAVEIAPIALFVVPFGLAFGVTATAKAIPPGISVFMSASVYAGASQMAALDLWRAPLPLAMLALTVLAVNARHILLGAALAPWLLQIPKGRRLLTLLFLSDANFAQAMAAHERGETDAGILFGSGLVMWSIWIVASAAGAYGGAYLGDLTRFGFDAVLVAYFTAVVIGQWKRPADLFPWLTAAVIAVAAWYLLPTGWHIIVGGLAGGFAGRCAMVADQTAIIAILLLTAVTVATRLAGVWIMSYVAITPRIAAFLRAMAVSVLIAIVVPITIHGTPRIWMAVGASAAVMLATRSSVGAMIAGAAAAALGHALSL